MRERNSILKELKDIHNFPNGALTSPTFARLMSQAVPPQQPGPPGSARSHQSADQRSVGSAAGGPVPTTTPDAIIKRVKNRDYSLTLWKQLLELDNLIQTQDAEVVSRKGLSRPPIVLGALTGDALWFKHLSHYKSERMQLKMGRDYFFVQWNRSTGPLCI